VRDRGGSGSRVRNSHDITTTRAVLRPAGRLREFAAACTIPPLTGYVKRPIDALQGRNQARPVVQVAHHDLGAEAWSGSVPLVQSTHQRPDRAAASRSRRTR